MADRKHTPDVLGEILGEVAAVEAPALQPSRPAAEPARPNGGQEGRTEAARRAETANRPGLSALPRPIEAARPGWEYRLVSFQNYRGWRPRFANGEEIPDWTTGPLIHDYLNQMGQAGWEVAAASAGSPLYGSTDQHQVYFKRSKNTAG